MKKIIPATLILIIAILIISGLILTGTANAEVYNCNGVYTNNPCNGNAESKTAPIVPKVSDAESENKKAISKKKSLTHDLSMKIYKINKEYKLAYSTEIIEDYCKQETTSVLDCSAKIDEMNGKIDDRIASLETIKAQKRANELQEKKLEDDADVTIIQQVFIEPTPTFDPWDHGHHDHGHWDDRPRPKPIKRPKYDRDGRPIVDKPPVDKLQTYGRGKKK